MGPPARVSLTPALRALADRGPDGEGTWHSADGRLHLGHTRLAVVARVDNAQPAVAPGGTRASVLNGELYGWRAQAAALRALGEHPTGGDGGLLPALYAVHGDALVHELRGEFAFAVADARGRRLVCARDRFGVKPLVWTVHEGALLIASQARALFALGVPRALCSVSMGHALAHQYLPPDRSMFVGVHALAPGHRLVAWLDAEDALHVEISLWAPMNWAPPGTAAPPTPIELLDALDTAVRLRLDSERPVGVHLGGGIDGAAVLALACRAAGPVPAFTLRFPGKGYDEGAAAAETAAHCGAPLTQVSVSHDDLLDELPGAVHAAEALCINGQLPARRRLDRALQRAGIVVVLSGEGSDELGLGYPHLLADGQVRAPGADAQSGVMLAALDGPSLPIVDQAMGYSPNFLVAKAAFGRRLLGLCHPGFEPETFPAEGGALAALFASLGPELAVLPPGLPRPHRSSWLWTRLCLGGYILRSIADAQEMSFGIEGRPPFLDDAVWSVLRRASVQSQLGSSGGKALLRAALVDVLPPSIVARPKHPFLAPPLAGVLTPPRRARVRDTLAAGLPAVPGVSTSLALAWLDALPPPGVQAPTTAAQNDAVLYTLLSAALLARSSPLENP